MNDLEESSEQLPMRKVREAINAQRKILLVKETMAVGLRTTPTEVYYLFTFRRSDI